MSKLEAVLPEDPEDALNMLGVLAARSAKSTARANSDRELRDQAIAEAVARPDINKTRVSIRMAVSRQVLYQIKDDVLRRLR